MLVVKFAWYGAHHKVFMKKKCLKYNLMWRKRKKKFIIINNTFSKRSYLAKNEKKNLCLITICPSTFVREEVFQSFSIKSCYTFFYP